MAYLSIIRINLAKVESLQGELSQNFNKLSNANDKLSSTKGQVDYAISARRSIGLRLNSSSRKLNELELRLNKIKSFVQFAIDKYDSTEKKIIQQAKQESRVQRKVYLTGLAHAGGAAQNGLVVN